MRLRQFGQLPRAFDLAQLPKDNSQVDRRSGLCICALAKRELNIERGVIARERRLEMRAGIGEGSLIQAYLPYQTARQRDVVQSADVSCFSEVSLSYRSRAPDLSAHQI